jgi:3'-phosphoadenosine 5'-phosphosulfate sulfotransferase (PAPS reductase)/FAD synthetase
MLRKTFACFSGGNDSLVSTHYAMTNNLAEEVLHVSTGIGVDENEHLSVREFVIKTCKKYNWRLRIETPPDLGYEKMVLKFGFPGPGAHTYPYVWLKERAIAKVVRETKLHHRDEIGLITGVRRTESARRMGFVEPRYKDGARVWLAPLFDKDKISCLEYIRDKELEVSPVVRLIGMSGECFCGAFAEKNELDIKIKPNFPKLYGRIIELQKRAKELDVPCRWGMPSKRRDKNQYKIPFLPMCVNCHGGH